jgi:multidrug efflux pump subunit AcrA (membrane-fusion protein)
MKGQVTIIAGTVALTLLLVGCQEETKAPEPVRPVLSMLLEPNRGDGTIAVGVVEPRYKTNLGFRVLGRLTSRPVYVGDLVNEGQIVGAIDPTALDLGVRSAKAQLAKAQAQLATAKATEERQRTLISSDATTKQTLDNAEQARAGVEATVAHEQANLTKAIEQLGYAQIKADFGGGRRRSRSGGLARPRCGHDRKTRHPRGGRRYRGGLPCAAGSRSTLHGESATPSRGSGRRQDTRGRAAGRSGDATATNSDRARQSP